MSEPNVIRLLTDANPVRADDLPRLAMPESIFDRRPLRRLALAAAVGAAALAASLIGVFAFSGSGSLPPSTPSGPGVAVPIPPQPIPLADASTALGAPLILPETPLLDASDVGRVTKECDPGKDQESGCVVTVRFPSQDVAIRYGRYGPPYTDPLPDYEASVAGDTFPGRKIVYLGGIPAFLTPKGDESPGSGSTIYFQLGETTISIFAQDYDGADVQSLARSIVGRSEPIPPPHGQATLADAAAVLGRPIVLPDTPFVGRSDAAPTVSTACPGPGQPGAVCQVTVAFPSQALTIRYLRGVRNEKRPPTSMIRTRYEAVVNHSPIGAKLVDLDGTPALFVPSQSSAPPWIEFFVGDVDVLAQGPLDEATLQAVAQSIVDRARGSSFPPTQALEPFVPDLHVGSVAAADALLPFKLVLPSARPLVIEVSPPKPPAYARETRPVHQSIAFFDTPTTGPYEVVEQSPDSPAGIQRVAQLREWAKGCHSRVVCPIHKVVVVHGTHVLLIGAPGQPGGLSALWLRGDRAGSVFSWIQGPTDYEHGDLSHHVFRPRAALAVAADIIAHGG